jgi:hypothetical protein
MRFSFGREAVALLLAVLGLTACAEDAVYPFDDAYLRRRAEEVRELEMLQEVPIIRMSREQYEAERAGDAEDLPDDALDELHETYGRLGFFREDADLRGEIGASFNFAIGVYWSDRKQIYLVGDVSEPVIVHELVHALQDQHFDLGAYHQDAGSSDEHLARRAVIEGDAELAEARFVMQERYGADLDSLDWAPYFASRRQWSDETLAESDLSLFFVAYPSFAYTYGLEYTASNLIGATLDSPLPSRVADWSREDALFTERPPTTTQQVLRRDANDEVFDVGMQEIPPTLARRLEVVYGDSLGEWYSRLLLLPQAPAGAAFVAKLAAAWDGDSALFVRDLRTGARGTVWASAWDDELAASQVEDALWVLYEATPGDADHPAGASLDGEPVWIERRGERVVALKNVDPSMAPELAEASFGSATTAKQHAPRRHPSLSTWLERSRKWIVSRPR